MHTSISDFFFSAPSFYIHPRSVTVLAGRPYSLECVGVLTKPSPSLTKFYMVDLLVPSALFYYPSDPGAPFHVKTAMAADNNSSMSCQFGGAPGPHVTTIYAEIAILTVHSKFAMHYLTLYYYYLRHFIEFCKKRVELKSRCGQSSL